ALYGGLFYRNKDAAFLSAGMDYNAWFVGISYDMNFSKLVPASRVRGGLEIAVRYIIHRFKPKKISHRICPVYIEFFSFSPWASHLMRKTTSRNTWSLRRSNTTKEITSMPWNTIQKRWSSTPIPLIFCGKLLKRTARTRIIAKPNIIMQKFTTAKKRRFIPLAYFSLV